MSIKKVRQNDIGTKFAIIVKDDGVIVPIDVATVMKMIFTKPSGTRLEKDAVHYTDGTDGILMYVSIAGDLDEVGVWQRQAYVEIPTWKGHSEVLTFKVEENL